MRPEVRDRRAADLPAHALRRAAGLGRLAVCMVPRSSGARTVRGVPAGLSARLSAVVDALPLVPGMRVVELGCGPGAAARAVAERLGTGFVLAVDRSPRAVAQARAAGAALIAAGRLEVREGAAEDLVLLEGEEPYDLAVAVRVGALDGRHPAQGEQVLRRLAAVLRPGGRLLVDGGNPLREVPVPR